MSEFDSAERVPSLETAGRQRRRWWTATLFILGSALFALGAVPAYSEAVRLEVTALTFFIGSLFFTAAGVLQYREAVDGLPVRPNHGRLFVWAPHDHNWLACAVQLAGTLWFNWSTGNELRHNLSAATADERVWRPDALGSIAFLVASGLAYAAVRHDVDGGTSGRTQWWIAVLNLLGSLAFGASAVAAYVIPASGDVWNAEVSNLGTLIGALCFLIGAILLLPRRRFRVVSA